MLFDKNSCLKFWCGLKKNKPSTKVAFWLQLKIFGVKQGALPEKRNTFTLFSFLSMF